MRAPGPSAFSGGAGGPKGSPLSPDSAMGLRRLLFGEPGGKFNVAWLQQEFVFSRYDGTQTGLSLFSPML